jgi:hypothetical protein
MRKIIIGLLLLLSFGASAQWQQTGSKVRYVNGLGIPTKDTAAGVSADSSQIVIRPADSSLYIKYKRTWIRVGGGGGSIGGTGTINYVPKFTASGFIGNSLIYDNGTAVGINTLTPTTTLQVGNGTGNPEITASGLNYDVVLGTPSGSALGFTTVGNYVGVYSNSSTKDLAFTHGNSRAITFGTGNQSRLTITASGRLLANTRTDNGVDALQVAGSMNVSTLATTNSLSVTNNATVGGTFLVTSISNFLNNVTVNGRVEATGAGGGATFRSKNNSSGNSNEFIANNTSAPFGYIGNFSGLIAGAAPYDTRDTIFALRGQTDLTLATGGAFERVRLTRGGQLNIGGSFTSTNNTLQVTGNAAIGYTSAAPTNGLIVSGNVGIGTASPTEKLHVSGGRIETSVTGTGAAYLVAKNTNGGTIFGNDGIGGYIFTDWNAPLLIYTNSTERMRITSGGEVLVGNTDNGAYNLQCNGTGVWGAGAYVNGSDSALKENILPIESSLQYVKLLKPVTYKYKKSFTSDSTIQTGFIAQDLVQVFKGKPLLDGLVKQGGKYLSVAYQNLIPLLTKAIQEQQSKIESLEERLAAIEAILKSNKIQ